MELYVLREDMYHDWAIENGACDLIGVYDDKGKVIDEFIKLINLEKEQGFYIDEYDLQNNINDFLKDNNVGFYVDVYCNKGGYENGCNYGSIVLETKILNENGTMGL